MRAKRELGTGTALKIAAVACVWASPLLAQETPQSGSLWATGRNQYGQLGDGTTTDRSTPVQVASDVTAVAGGGFHSLFVKTDGSLWAMGRNLYGQLGDGTTADRSKPVQVASGVASVAAGWYHSFFIKTDGSLWAMGQNFNGQLGDGTTTDRSTPVQVASDAVSVTGGGSHSLFIKTDGSLWAMGWNLRGQLGDGTTTDRSTPVQVASGVVAVAGGGFHSLFIKTDGSLWAMGRNLYGQLGDGTVTDRSTPVQIAPGIDAVDDVEAEIITVAEVSAGWYHSFFIKTDDSLWVAGQNFDGQLADGTQTDRSTPVQVVSDVADFAAVAGGGFHSLLIKTDGSLWAAGDNTDGQLGDGSTTDHSTPVEVASDVTAVAAGGDHSLFIAKKEVPTDPLIGGTTVNGLEGWFRSEWFGYYSTALAPWLVHAEHGFIYRYPESTNESIRVYDNAMDAWWWTNEVDYPYLYRFTDGVWLYYQEGSSNPRWFYNLGTESWESL